MISSVFVGTVTDVISLLKGVARATVLRLHHFLVTDFLDTVDLPTIWVIERNHHWSDISCHHEKNTANKSKHLLSRTAILPKRSPTTVTP